MSGIFTIRRLFREELGQDLLEYGMLASLIAVVCYLAVESGGEAILRVLDGIQVQLSALPAIGG